MPAFKVEKVAEDQPCFRVLCPDETVCIEITEFLEHLSICGRSGYTLRAYATGLAHFFSWLHDSGKSPDDVTRHVTGQYIGAFGKSPGLGPRAPRQTTSKQNGINAGSTQGRRPRTVNHRLSVLASYFAFRIRRDQETGGVWAQRYNPVSTPIEGPRHCAAGRDSPVRVRSGEFRRRVPRQLPKQIEPAVAQQLIDTAISCRDRAILTLLLRTGQRIGDWSDIAGRHSILGMTLADVDERGRAITVRLKGARDEHQVPVTDDFWPVFHRYLNEERVPTNATSAAWLGLRRGKGEPLSYVAFESSLRYISRKVGVRVHAHMFRHTLAQGILDVTGNLKVAQEILGHAQLSTTADLYMHIDHAALVEAVAAVKFAFEKESGANVEAKADPRKRYAFPYDEHTLAELEQAAAQPRTMKDLHDTKIIE